MKIIDRYIIKEAAFITLIGFFVFTFLLIMNSLFVMSDLVVKYNVDFFRVAKLLILILPSQVAVTVPMAFLVGILLTYSRLVQDNEYSGMQASGISVRSIAIPGVILSLALMAGLIFFNNQILPKANLEYKKLYYEIVKTRSNILIQEHEFIRSFDNYVFYISEKDSRENLLKNIIIFVKDKGKERETEPIKVILSRKGRLISDEETLRIALKLDSGIMQAASYVNPLKMNLISFDTNFIDLDVRGVFRRHQNESELKGTREMTIGELLNEIRKGTESTHDKNWIYIEFYKKFSLPFAVVAFALIGIPLGLMTKKGGRVIGMAYSLVLIVLYYFLISIGQNMGYRGEMNHFAAAWLPNIVTCAIAAVLFAALFFPFLKRRLYKNRRIK
ncbi:MAG TPA: YjgP/YjgQ family permease [bacterium]|nr:YjgP/YjgQ family permease [bacterium]